MSPLQYIEQQVMKNISLLKSLIGDGGVVVFVSPGAYIEPHISSPRIDIVEGAKAKPQRVCKI